MFNSYDMKRFGEALKKIRNKYNITQKEISEQSGIHIDTLRRIENGFVIPKYETLEHLSIYYKSDLFELLNQTRSNLLLNSLYEELDNYILNNNITGIKSILSQFQAIISQEANHLALIHPDELILLDGLSSAGLLYYENTTESIKTAEKLLLNLLFQSTTVPSSDILVERNTSFLEIRIILLLAIIEKSLKNYDNCQSLLLYLLSYITDETLILPQSQNYIPKIYLNLSYCEFMKGNDLKAIEYADKGISNNIKTNSLYCLFALYYCKGISEFLSNQHYETSLKNCVALMKMQNLNDLYNKYQQITLKQYHINLDNYI